MAILCGRPSFATTCRKAPEPEHLSFERMAETSGANAPAHPEILFALPRGLPTLMRCAARNRPELIRQGRRRTPGVFQHVFGPTTAY